MPYLGRGSQRFSQRKPRVSESAEPSFPLPLGGIASALGLSFPGASLALPLAREALGSLPYVGSLLGGGSVSRAELARQRGVPESQIPVFHLG